MHLFAQFSIYSLWKRLTAHLFLNKNLPVPQKYKTLNSEEEKKALLANLMVQGEEKKRRIGPEISARVYRNFTVQNPQLVLD